MDEAERGPAHPRPQRRGRRRGRRLRSGRQNLLETLLPGLTIGPLPPAGQLALDRLFDVGCDDVWLEIGFGAGEHLAAQARVNPRVGFLGAEPYINGIASLLNAIAADGLGNIRLWPEEGEPLLEALSAGSIGRAFVLFSDPWPKARHHKRRFIGKRAVDGFARILKDGAELRIATDDVGYVSWILSHVLAHSAFEWTAQTPADWRIRPPDWPQTRYEAKARAAGRPAFFLRFRRRFR
jgi:tRNA (guanine-N7-)-methyltransferase